MTQFAHYPSLADKAVIITGGASGIGAEIVRAFSAQGAKVGFLDLDADASAALRDECDGTVDYEICDLRDIAAMKAALAALGLGDDSPRLIGPRVHQPRQTARKPRRESGPPQRVQPSRSRSAPDRLSAGLELEDVEAVERSARKKRQRRVFREEGGDAAFPRTEILVAESRWTLPALPGGGRHNSSCHLCARAGVAERARLRKAWSP